MVKTKVNFSKLSNIRKPSSETLREIAENSKFIYISNEEIINAIKNLPVERSKKGSGRKAKQIACQFNISESTVYMIMKILREAPEKIIYDLRNENITIKEAYKLFKKNNVKYFDYNENTVSNVTNAIILAHVKLSKLETHLTEEKQHDILDEVKGYLIDAQEILNNISF